MSSIAQPSPAPNTSPTSSPSGKSDPDQSARITQLEKEVERLKKSPKDGWDKLSAISGLISGGLVVLLGLFVTYRLNERSRVTAEQQKNRELAVAQVQTVASFMPHLQSEKQKEVEAALLAIFALDQKLGKDSQLAMNLAGLYRNEGSISALRQIASGPDAESAKVAQATLDDLFTVSLKDFSPAYDDLRLSAKSLRTFYDLTNQIYWALQGAVGPFTYEKSWILRDAVTHKEFRKLRAKDGSILPFDIRKLETVGIKPGMTLEALRVNSSQDDEPQTP